MSGTSPDSVSYPVIPYGMRSPWGTTTVIALDYTSGDGQNDDTEGLEAAIANLPAYGGKLYLPAAQYVLRRTLFIPPYTEVYGDGWSTIIQRLSDDEWDNPVFTPVHSTWYTPGRVFFCNSNWDTDQLVDGYYRIRNIQFQCGAASAAVRKGAAHFYRCRNVEVSGILTTGGGGQIACMGTDQTNFHDNVFYDFRTTAVDHFAGFTNARVINNFFRKDPLTNEEPSIQFTGTNGDNTANQSRGFICGYNRVYGGAANVYAIGITNRGDTNSRVDDGLFIGNLIDVNGKAGGGLGCYGGQDNITIIGNTIKNVADYTALAVFPNGFGDATRIMMTDNTVLDSTRTSGGATLINVLAAGASVYDNAILNCTAGTGTNVNGAGSILRPGNTYQSTLTTQYTVGGGAVVDAQVVGTWTPQLQFGGVSTGITYSTQTGTYVRDGVNVYVECSMVLTNKGAAVGTAQIAGLPFPDATGVVPSRLLPTSIANTVGLTEEPVIRVSSQTIVLTTSIVGGVNLTDANFANNTNLFFAGWYRID